MKDEKNLRALAREVRASPGIIRRHYLRKVRGETTVVEASEGRRKQAEQKTWWEPRTRTRVSTYPGHSVAVHVLYTKRWAGVATERYSGKCMHGSY